MDIKTTARTAIDNGFAPVPRYKKNGEWKLYRFINEQTGNYGYLEDHRAWDAVDMPMVSLVLLDCVLIDLDANKDSCSDDIETLKEKVCDLLGISYFDLYMAQFQSNDAGDSLHYLFKLPSSINWADISQSNDGKLIENVDFKVGRQLVHLKPGKTIEWCNTDDIPTLTEDNVYSIFKRKKKPAETAAFKSTDVTSKYGNGVLRGVGHEATTFTAEGGRNSALARAVVSIYEYVGGGEIADTDAENKIIEIVEELGIADEPDTQTTIDHNKKKGLDQPKAAPRNSEKIKSVLKNDINRKRAEESLNSADKFITEKVGFKIHTDLDIANAMLVSCFWNPQQNRLSTINDVDEKVIFAEKDVNQMLVAFFGNPITNYDDLVIHCEDEDLKLTQTAKNNIINSAMNNIVRCIKAYYQRSALEQRVDMFADRTYFQFTPDKAVEQHKHIALLPPKGRLVDEEAVRDYKGHFPQVDDVLAMVIASRFASSRKKAYLWIKAQSDWGKDFFRVALGGIATEMSVKEVEKAIEGAPVGKSPTDFLRSMVLVTNEFKKVKSELKQLEDGIKLSPKYQLETFVPLYLKVFLSAEGVDSLMGEHGVEEQFANRFSLLEFDGVIHNLPSFKRLGGHKMMQSIQTYFSDVLNAQIEKYRAMGKDEAARAGDEYVVRFHKKYAIANGKKILSDNLEEVANTVKDELIKQFRNYSHLSGSYMFLTSAKTRVKNVLRDPNVFDRAEGYTLSHKADGILSIICPDSIGIKGYKIEGKTTKALKIFLGDDFDILVDDPFED